MSFFSFRTLFSDSKIVKMIAERGASQLIPSQITVTTTSQQLVAANQNRRSITIRNISAQNVYITGTSPATTSHFPIATNSEKTFEEYTGAIYAIVSATTADVRVIQEVI
jgi:hypothetical protein